MKILVSACLLGHNVRYDGKSKPSNQIIELSKNHELIPICPEFMGGFRIPHDPIENKNGRIVTKNAKDETAKLIKGSKIALDKYLVNNCAFAILKSKSPSCGRDYIYDGNFNNTLIMGDGFFTKILKENNIKIFNENEIEEINNYIEKLK